MRLLALAIWKSCCCPRLCGSITRGCWRAQLRLWLSLTEGAGGAKPSDEGLRLRLAALAACGIASARQSTELQLPRLLYTGRS